MFRRFGWNRLYATSIKTKIFLCYASLIVIIFIACSIVLYTYMMSFTRNFVSDYTTSANRQMNAKLEGWMQEIETLSKAVMWNASVRSIIVKTGTNESSDSDKQDLYKFLSMLTISRDDIYSIQLLKDSQFAMKFGTYYDSDLEMKPILDAIRSADDRYRQGQVIFAGTVIRHAADNEATFAVARKIYDKFTFSAIGDVIIEIRYSKLKGMLQALENTKNKRNQLLDDKGRIIYSEKEEEIGQLADPAYLQAIWSADEASGFTELAASGGMLTYSRSAYTQWTLLSVTPLSEISSPFRNMQQIFFVVNLIGITLALVIAAMLSKSITKPLTKLVNKMKGIRLGSIRLNDSRNRLPLNDYNEIQKLNNTFNDMIESINRMIQEVYEAELRQKDAELKMLRAQINPHFLYNTLDVINWKLVINEQDEIARLVRALSALLRYNITESDKPVHIREEIGQITNYLQIQQARFEDTIELEIGVPPEVMNMKMCKFLLQPIVENAIMHGFKQRNHGKIVINGEIREGSLLLDIIDNGSGMCRNTLDKLNANLEVAADSRSTTGIGVHNVSQRVALYYGEPYHIRFESIPGQGTTVHLKLPVIE
ncbi:cache domain-containing sensor histidine kinase [Paenibacillus thalictri]|uniref:histidine kinase n=1 Tax=Paenibacillus thalictri TaxID=2527873 RepID=A0A4V2J3M0_9BACL|nr:sensor histidine kinase [Paenibacillus thalictri]TBL73884.1 sensor histidine kinase [Paenibacillus thalictri]